MKCFVVISRKDMGFNHMILKKQVKRLTIIVSSDIINTMSVYNLFSVV